LSIFVAGVARQVADKNVTINNLLPGAFETDRLKTVLGGAAKRKGISYDEAKAERIASIPAKRLGETAEFGAACAFLCSAQAGFITGQNLLVDGGAFPGAL
jgi:3-oxoacyl-[acyl-carrier protein] reductase